MLTSFRDDPEKPTSRHSVPARFQCAFILAMSAAPLISKGLDVSNRKPKRSRVVFTLDLPGPVQDCGRPLESDACRVLAWQLIADLTAKLVTQCRKCP